MATYWKWDENRESKKYDKIYQIEAQTYNEIAKEIQTDYYSSISNMMSYNIKYRNDKVEYDKAKWKNCQSYPE